ncbi:MAG: NAD(P)H-dependent oxidoreductase [Chloroflexota bacterium]
MKIHVISSSLSDESRSRKVAHIYHRRLRNRSIQSELIDLKEVNPPNFDNSSIFQTEVYKNLHMKLDEADGLVFASPVYNWGCCAELKKLIEYIGSTPMDGSLKGALFDKVITFVNAAGLPHSYMAYTTLASSLMLDFKCIINPYNVYIHNRHWNEEESLIDEAQKRIEKSVKVMIELTTLLKPRTYSSTWEI